MEAKPGEGVVGAQGGGEGTEAAANSIAEGARTKPVPASVLPTKRKPVKMMMWDSAAAWFSSASTNNNNHHHHHHDDNNNKTFAA
ncbi:hypothetical protein RHGRI_003869 [Rhododendron griersonianum]|uniref:Uncharacterized protein n=1 Tax=Rhododendron griersonianum TaxID=479676 RepID=A0AAV6L968_9ERIC|nr:hypothetical protein RHGRI_003869 [Rhododendron griersonianum]